MGRIRIVTEIGESCVSWTCYKCGECIDAEILKNRGVGVSIASGKNYKEPLIPQMVIPRPRIDSI